MNLPRIAITGGIAEGKSTVLGILKSNGVATWSADQVATDLWARPDVYEAICDVAGCEIGASRKDVLTAILSSVDRRRNLNELLHPLVMQDLESSEAVAFEVPLLIEACMPEDFDHVWVVTCGLEEQNRRLRERGFSEDQISQLLSFQISTKAKIPFASEVIRTNFPLQNVRENVEECLFRVSRWR